MAIRPLCVILVALVLPVSPAEAQNWSFDARQIALGSAGGGNENIGSQMMAEEKGYRSIVLPFGLFQVLRNPNVFNPESDDFDIVKAIEYAAAPLHYQFGRDDTDTASGRTLPVDIANARLSRDLNTYRGFELRNQPASEGLSSPTWGVTIPVPGTPHGVYLGAGPYLAMRNEASIDQRIIDIFASPVDVYLPNTSFLIGNQTTAQFAASFVGGYRGRFPVGTSEDAVFAGVNYRYLRGFRLEDGDIDVRLDTDSGGLLTINPLAPFPLGITRDHATSGNGFAIDFGLGARIGGVDASFAVNGIANRIEWSGVERRTYVLGNLLTGDDGLIRSPAVALGDRRIELPVDYRAHAGYRSDRWYGLFEFAHGFQDTSFRTGLECRAGAVELRGGAMYVRDDWNPTGGIGFNFSRRVGLDLALYGTTANAARERRTALAVSLRFMREPAQP